jgi:hypothetical protein
MRKTNKGLIKKLMPDTVGEAFVLEAVTKYCQTVLADETDWGNKALINKDLWQVIAKHNLETIKEHYK